MSWAVHGSKDKGDIDMNSEERKTKASQWLGQYFGKRNGAAHGAFAKFCSDKKTHEILLSADSETWYVNSLLEAMSTLFSAIRSVWQFWRIFEIIGLIPKLKSLCDEYEKVRKELPKHISPQSDEIYVACTMLLGFITRITSSDDYRYEENARKVGEEALACLYAQENPALSTTLLLKARLSRNPVVSKVYRKTYHDDVYRALRRLACLNYSAEDMENEIGQGYKTVCRLGRMIGYWKACRVALRYDKSRDLVGKTIIIPQYWSYWLRYNLFLTD